MVQFLQNGKNGKNFDACLAIFDALIAAALSLGLKAGR